MENKQTAVEWLAEQIKNDQNQKALTPTEWMRVIEQAKQMEKEQMKDAFVECWKSNIPDGVECKLDAEQYYNETYNKCV